MKLNDWLGNAVGAARGEEGYLPRLRVILKAGNEIEIDYDPAGDIFGSTDEITHSRYIIDTRSVAAIVLLNPAS